MLDYAGEEDHQCLLAFYCELAQSEKAYIKCRFSFNHERYNEAAKNDPKLELNFRFGKTPQVHYTNGNEKSFILMLSKLDPKKKFWIHKNA